MGEGAGCKKEGSYLRAQGQEEFFFSFQKENSEAFCVLVEIITETGSMGEERVSVGTEPWGGRWGWHLVPRRVEWHMPVVPGLGRRRQEEHQEFTLNLGFTATSRLAWATSDSV